MFLSSFLCEGPHMAGCIISLGYPLEKIRVHHFRGKGRNASFHTTQMASR
jgi:hypothetical protein